MTLSQPLCRCALKAGVEVRDESSKRPASASCCSSFSSRLLVAFPLSFAFPFLPHLPSLPFAFSLCQLTRLQLLLALIFAGLLAVLTAFAVFTLTAFLAQASTSMGTATPWEPPRLRHTVLGVRR
eukprot:4520959-Amphidinium_carterae.2